MLNGFSVEYNGILLSDSRDFEIGAKDVIKTLENGALMKTCTYFSQERGIEVKNIIITHPGLNIIEKWVEVSNQSRLSARITRVDSVRGLLPQGSYSLKYFTSAWGKEFTPNDVRLEGTKILEVTSGRSSNGMHPWGSVTSEDGSILTFALAWSGNWVVRFEPAEGSRYLFTGGISSWNFFKVLEPGQSMEGIHIIYEYLQRGDLVDTSSDFGTWGKKYCYPPNNPHSKTMPVEWNSWWPYEDHRLNECIMKANAEECVKAGIDVATLDSGWFGTPVEGLNWYRIRGDWHKVNANRFPSGIRSLSDQLHNMGLKFGIWCEIEAAGNKAEINELHPELLARRDGNSLGYICMGNPAAVIWAFKVAERLINEYGADWLKFDFNLDPGAGCNDVSHGHGEGDGLYEHYMGYYRLLDQIREKYPNVILENCSSGGLRIDLRLMKCAHVTHLSDPDYTENHLQVFWGASTMLHPSVCLHFAWSQSLYEMNVKKEPISGNMQTHVFDYYVRSVMTGVPGFSWRLPELPAWCKERLKYHIDFYNRISQKFIRDGIFYLLTGQAVRNGGGDRWNAFLYVLEDSSEALLFVFRLSGGQNKRSIKLRGLDKDNVYHLYFEDSKKQLDISSDELMDTGIGFETIDEEGSEIIFIERID